MNRNQQILSPSSLLSKDIGTVKKLRFETIQSDLNIIQNDISNRKQYNSIGIEEKTKKIQDRYPGAGSSKVKTINLEMPINYGTDRAIVCYTNKIQPKKSLKKPAASKKNVLKMDRTTTRAAVIENPVTAEPFQLTAHHHQSRKKEETLLPEKPLTLQSQPTSMTPLISKHSSSTHHHRNKSKSKKQCRKNTLISTLSNINDKLTVLQEKYFSQPKIQYRNVNDCFTQCSRMAGDRNGNEVERTFSSGSLKSILINRNMSEKESSVMDNYFMEQMPFNWDDNKMQDHIKEMNEIFLDLPKTEEIFQKIDELPDMEEQKEQEAIDDIVDASKETIIKENDRYEILNKGKNEKEQKSKEGLECNFYQSDLNFLDRIQQSDYLNSLFSPLNMESALEVDAALRKEIDSVQNIYQQISTLQNITDNGTAQSLEKLESLEYDLVDYEQNNKLQNMDSNSTADKINDDSQQEQQQQQHNHHSIKTTTTNSLLHTQANNSTMSSNFIERPELEVAIKKSNYLSKEFNQLVDRPMVKIFTDRCKKTMPKFKRYRNNYPSNMVEEEQQRQLNSVEQLIDSLKSTFSETFFEPVN